MQGFIYVEAERQSHVDAAVRGLRNIFGFKVRAPRGVLSLLWFLLFTQSFATVQASSRSLGPKACLCT